PADYRRRAVFVGLHPVHRNHPARPRVHYPPRGFGLPRGVLLQRRLAFARADPTRQRARHAALSTSDPRLDQSARWTAAASDQEARPGIERSLFYLSVSVTLKIGAAPPRLRCFSPLSAGEFRPI